jgi:acetyltransferase-like isoleucine patch superfamily enzyme
MFALEGLVHKISYSGFLSNHDLELIGLKEFGDDCRIDSSVRFLNPSNISLGSGVRIDAFSILSSGDGYIEVGDRVHISHSVRIYGAGGVILGFACGVSSGCAIYSQTDDFASGHLAHPTVPVELRKVYSKEIKIGDYCIVGANSVLLPGAEMGKGAAVGALSLLKRKVPPLEIFGGSPAKRIALRDSVTFENQVQKLNAISS